MTSYFVKLPQLQCLVENSLVNLICENIFFAMVLICEILANSVNKGTAAS